MFALDVCVAIPVAARHLPWLRECLASVTAQTMTPSRIAVHVSGAPCPKELGPTVVCASTPTKLWAGDNRNRAFRLCGEVMYVSFLDADDLMMPYALERMVGLMRENNASVGLHSYFDDEPVVRRHAQLRSHVHHRHPPLDLKPHHGHVTVRTADYRLQDPKLARGQDSAFVLDMWEHNRSFVHTEERLTQYMHRNTLRRARGPQNRRVAPHGRTRRDQ